MLKPPSGLVWERRQCFPIARRRASRFESLGDNTLGHKITGAGGGGYVVLVSERPIEGAIRVKIRREQ